MHFGYYAFQKYEFKVTTAAGLHRRTNYKPVIALNLQGMSHTKTVDVEGHEVISGTMRANFALHRDKQLKHIKVKDHHSKKEEEGN